MGGRGDRERVSWGQAKDNTSARRKTTALRSGRILAECFRAVLCYNSFES